MNDQPHAPAFASQLPLRAERFLDVADAIGCEIVRDAVWAGDRCNWLIWTKEPVGGTFRSVYRAAALDLYSGTSGIALFLARLVAATGDPHQRRVLRGATRQIRAQIAEGMTHPIGLYTGALGAGWVLAQIGECLGEEDLIDAGLASMEAAARQKAPHEALDLLSGRAGAILALIGMAQQHRRPALIELAEALAAELIEAGQPSAEGLSWPFQAGGGRNLLGLSHGTAGMALALFELAAAASNERYREAARSALRYERHHFDHARGAWPDFRTMPGQPPGTPAYPAAWCHGSTGIGLSRLRIRELEPDDALVLPEIDAAIASAIRSLNSPAGASGDFSLCHGVTGNSELLLAVGEKFGRPEAFAAAHQIGDLGIARFHEPRCPWACGVPDAGETPSLMLGTAGIGLHYLRLYDPSSSPSIALPSAGLRPEPVRSANSTE